jgi:hypothetical protein
MALINVPKKETGRNYKLQFRIITKAGEGRISAFLKRGCL